MTAPKPSGSKWAKWLLAANVAGLAAAGGYRLSSDSPVHLMTEGKMPEQADEWVCQPEGGLIGAPVVCRPRAGVHVVAPQQPGHDGDASTSRGTGTSQE